MISAFCLTAPNSGEGKTTLSIGLMRLFSQKYAVQAFKCGPDYIDTSYHKIASGNTSYNLDSWLMGEEEVLRTFYSQTNCSQKACDIAIVEGVMGLFDGKKSADNPEESQKSLPSIAGSTAHIAQLLSLPLILVIDCKGMAQSISAIVRGFQSHCREYGLYLAGIIANNVGSEKHYAILKESLTAWNLPPLLGYIPKNLTISFKERQLGLSHIFADETKNADLESKLDELAGILAQHIDIDTLLSATKYTQAPKNLSPTAPKVQANKTIGIAYDEAFCFYYPQNLEALKSLGYTLHYFSPLKDTKLPKLDALYLGGGYPEIYANTLSNNTAMCGAIKEFAEEYGNIFAECGGFMYLCSSLATSEHNAQENRIAEQAKPQIYPLCNVINATAAMGTRLRSLGYRQGTLLQKPFFWESEETKFRAHEFHWSDIELHEDYAPFIKIGQNVFGIHYKNVFASYLHFYFAYLFNGGEKL